MDANTVGQTIVALAADEDRNEAIEISNLIAAVNHALDGCPAS